MICSGINTRPRAADVSLLRRDAEKTKRKREGGFRGANGYSRHEFRRKNFPAFRWIDWRIDQIKRERGRQGCPPTGRTVSLQPGRLKGCNLVRARETAWPDALRFREAIRGCDRSLEARGDTVLSADNTCYRVAERPRSRLRFAIGNNRRRGNLITGIVTRGRPYGKN